MWEFIDVSPVFTKKQFIFFWYILRRRTFGTTVKKNDHYLNFIFQPGNNFFSIFDIIDIAGTFIWSETRKAEF